MFLVTGVMSLLGPGRWMQAWYCLFAMVGEESGWRCSWPRVKMTKSQTPLSLSYPVMPSCFQGKSGPVYKEQILLVFPKDHEHRHPFFLPDPGKHAAPTPGVPPGTMSRPGKALHQPRPRILSPLAPSRPRQTRSTNIRRTHGQKHCHPHSSQTSSTKTSGPASNAPAPAKTPHP